MTEKEARTKWCPMMRREGGKSANTYSTDESGRAGYCIGSECMMWREYGSPSLDDHMFLVQTQYLSHEKATEELRRKYPAGREGYCGLAGRP